MKVKKYVAPTMPEAMSIIRKELGSDAVILSSKEIQEGGFLGFFKKRKIEVIAALDNQPMPVKQIKTGSSKVETNKSKGTTESELIKEMKSMRRILEQQSQQHNQNKFELDYQVLYQYLLEQEVDEEISTRVIRNVVKKQQENKITPNAHNIAKAVQQEIELELSRLSFKGISNSAKIVHFFGPTGVGKTTTLAKVAANSMLNDGKKVAFITMDTYRIAAIEHLKTYAKILSVPVEVAYSLEDYKAAMKKLDNYDLILVDTAGRNYRDTQYVKELTQNIVTDERVENYVVLSLTTKPKDINDIYYSFRQVNINGFIFTKIDETRQYGSLINLPLKEKIGIAYITNGQEVPDNIIKPSAEIISNYIVGDLIDS